MAVQLVEADAPLALAPGVRKAMRVCPASRPSCACTLPLSSLLLPVRVASAAAKPWVST